MRTPSPRLRLRLCLRLRHHLPSPRPLPLPSRLARSPWPQPSDFYAKVRAYPEMLLFYAEKVLPLDAEHGCKWRERWGDARKNKALQQQISKFYFAVEWMVYAADFDIAAITDVVRGFKSSALKITEAAEKARTTRAQGAGRSVCSPTRGRRCRPPFSRRRACLLRLLLLLPLR